MKLLGDYRNIVGGGVVIAVSIAGGGVVCVCGVDNKRLVLVVVDV